MFQMDFVQSFGREFELANEPAADSDLPLC